MPKSDYTLEPIQIQVCLHKADLFFIKGEHKMSVIIKLNGLYIGEATMTKSEIRKAENAGFTILRNKKGE